MLYCIFDSMNETRTIIERISEYNERQADLKLNSEELGTLIVALKVAEEKSAMLHSIIESTDDAILSKDLNGIINSWNNSAERIFGYSAEEIIGKSILTLIPLHLHKEEPGIIEQIRKGIRVDHFETQRLRKDGTLVDVSLTISPMYNSAGEFIGISKIVRDLTLHRKAEVEGKRLMSIVESSDDAIISKDLDSIITSWNDSAVRIFGYQAEEMIGQSILKIIPPERHDEEPRILAQLSQGIRVEHFETERMKKDGSLIHVSLTISPIKDKSGKVIGLSKIARDITDKKLMDRKKDEFMAFVSHELKTPLTSLKSYIQIARQKLTNTEFIATALGRAETQTNKMERMISGFLNLSRSEEGLLKLLEEQFDIAQVINFCVNDAKMISQVHEITLNTPHQVWVNADKEKISMVITNLISNAVKYSPNGGKVVVSCEVFDKKCRIKVSDEGIGISKAHQVDMFKKFYRIESNETKNISGFGIGLYLSSTILALHQSELKLDSEIGKGSTFFFDLKLD